jgi:hypothetical protein
LVGGPDNKMGGHWWEGLIIRWVVIGGRA